jgi:hypothetical protein
MSGPVNLGDYVDVPTRLKLALEKHPDLRIQEDAPGVVEVDGHYFVTVRVTVWRHFDDSRPAIATAWEPFPGRTPYTSDSEMMNASTSALGRALGFMGFGISKSIASANEVAARASESDAPPRERRPWAPSDAQKRLLKALGYAGEAPTQKAAFDALVDRLKANKAEGQSRPEQPRPPDNDEEPF